MSSGCFVKWFGDEVTDKLQQVALEALWLAGQGAITHSINDVPLETGTLRRSGVVTADELPNAAEVYSDAQNGRGKYSKSARSKDEPPAAANKKSPRVFVSYNTPYAIRLHEGHWKPRDWKYTADEIITKRSITVSVPIASFSLENLQRAFPGSEIKTAATETVQKVNYTSLI